MAKGPKLSTIINRMANSVEYSVEIRHEGLNRYQLIKGKNKTDVEQRAKAKLAQWADMWARTQAAEQKRMTREKISMNREQKKILAGEKTNEAQEKLQELKAILTSSLAVKHAINWELSKDHSKFPTPQPKPPSISKKPQLIDFAPELKFKDKVFKKRKQEKEEKAQTEWLSALENWEKERQKIEYEFEQKCKEWEEALAQFEKEQEEANNLIDEKIKRFYAYEPEAIFSYFQEILDKSSYPDYFPSTYEMDMDIENKILILDYELPDMSQLPTLKEVKYIQTRDEFVERHISQTETNRQYDEALFQVALRTLYELFDADINDNLSLVVFNGYVNSIDPATGKKQMACILSIQANKEEFTQLNLANVEPKACFNNLKGISSAKLYSLTPIAPIMVIDKEDQRFISSYNVADYVGEETNLAAMDWEDFEHLIREIFEKEFQSNGGEVKVTRASRDGGIDAVAFDPDPIRGGKIVIQAKRYTNTVGVSAIRDLYGAVINEGAAKGIIVTTSNYGADSYEFAKGKPLTLLNGNNLLNLLEKYGHKAKIDLAEAKKILKG